MFAVNGNRPGPFPGGQTYGEVQAAARREEAEQAGINAALSIQADRVIAQSELNPDDNITGVNNDNVNEVQSNATLARGTFDTSKGVLGLSFIA